MAKRLPKPFRIMLFCAFGLVFAATTVLIVGAVLLGPERPEPVVLAPRLWHDASAGDRIEINGYTFEMPVDGVYSRLDASYGPDLEGVLLVRENPSRGSELVVGRLSRLTPDTTIHPDRIGKIFLAWADETRARADDLRLITLAPRMDVLPQRVAALCLPADVYLFSDGITFKVEHMTKIMESWAPVETE